ncbi:hypothetical protein DSO57_1030374 [Entomophthora muscae]|uniref:Uncharacterized protein n=3 Tax=Entomophthora muscae TaxID=34485 RepID=A0ACC2SZC8_9FUNG|nr:hypothetical protein DSO57_1012747 [Entomophthora muscae]KAJ9067457.1 hypothetical protein DSO57_1038890 [Entomophthora muscae]KAJ9072134.1 hypothetical protein DSO57_1030374 [Entomophthora muscae]
MSSNGYDNIIPGSLKLKGVGIVKKKKKKAKKQESEPAKEEAYVAPKIRKTEAELKFERIQNQRLKEKVEDMAKRSHKDKVQEFNKKLEKLSEHYDIPKVGPG